MTLSDASQVVPIATHAIDRFAYDGCDVRKRIHEELIPDEYEVVDLGCGVGFSAARNGKCIGVDTSEQMLAVARLRRPDVKASSAPVEKAAPPRWRTARPLPPPRSAIWSRGCRLRAWGGSAAAPRSQAGVWAPA